ncbi:membrane protein [Granulicatella balaenopterae]|uniref:Membrane protein n=1 Tax=Granulicatella balaenopterae TaxID=137733 RepID=A0A1H9I2P1_9LACT|nr:YihY/virulence factor BrkB family protein [Granulicatella balaenopterae]SEQ68807.1 membrane protein [Granulicatella balaenopterae]
MTIKIFLKAMIEKVQQNDLFNIGAMLAYYLLFSIFPFLIFLLNIVGLIAAEYQQDILELLQVLPKNVVEIINPILTSMIHSSSGTLLSVSLLVALWAGSKGIIKLMGEVSRAFGSTKPHSFLVTRALGLLFTLALSAMMVVLVSANVFGDIIYHYVVSLVGEKELLVEVFHLLRGIVPFLVMVIIFALLYRFSPSADVKRKITIIDMLPGALFTSVSWVVITNAFSFYVNNFGRYDATYGSLGGIIVLLLWLYLSSIVMVLGAYVSSVYVDLKEQDKLEIK